MDNETNATDLENIKELSQSVMKAVLGCTKAANKLPTEDDYEYYETFKGFRSVMGKAQKDVLSLLSSLMKDNAIRKHFAELDVEEQFDMIKNMNSSIFENLSNQIAESSGKKAEENELISVNNSAVEINTSWNRKDFLNRKMSSVSLLSAKNIPRPQIRFKTKIDNSNSPFVPIIKEKPNSIRPLAVLLEKDGNSEEFSHPYECELEKFHPDPEQLESCTPMLPRSLTETPLIMVETEEDLKSLCQVLQGVKEFAIDVEHHSYRTFQGISCLIQISTREKDYIIDAISLRSELWILNEVFTDPKITKVLHGADMDILWLQRDFGLYVVNMFDTGQAARVLSFPHLSLVYLLRHYCNISLDKRYQMADWRIRPLPNELLKYAREDTHYLLYVYDCMRNKLITEGNQNNNLLLSVYQRSKQICLKRYEKLLLTEESYMELYKKSRKSFNGKQLYCLKELYEWRDKIARVEDESYGYVLPSHMLLQIAELLPRDHQGILACCNPVPPLVKQQLNELHMVVMRASLLSSAQLQEKIEVPANLSIDMTVDLNNVLHCPHDIHLYEGRTEHEFHLSGSRIDVAVSSASAVKTPLKIKSSIIIGKELEKKVTRADLTAKDVSCEIGGNFKTMFERYLLTKKHFNSQSGETKMISSESNPSKESDEKSFIEVMNPALKVAFSSESRKKDKSGSNRYRFVNEGASTSNPSESSKQVKDSSFQSDVASSSGVDDVQSPASSSSQVIANEGGLTVKKESKKRPSPSKPAKRDAKKQKTGAVADDFQPFNYETSSFSELVQSSGSQKRKNSSFDPFQGRNNSKGPGGKKQNRRSQKLQKTFAATSSSDSGKKKWPKS